MAILVNDITFCCLQVLLPLLLYMDQGPLPAAKAKMLDA